MRDWQLSAGSPLSMRFAADVRLTPTDYVDDQSWEVVFGGEQEPALAFATRYGGRVGIARLVPMWVINGTPVYETSAFSEKPTLRKFAPNYAKVIFSPVADLAVTAELWVMDSHAVGLRFGLENTSGKEQSLQLEMFAQIVREGEMINMNLLTLDDGSEALHLGVVGNLNPILLLESATAALTRPGEHVSPKLTTPITIPAGASVSVCSIHVGRPSMNDSLQLAFRWLNKIDWDAGLQVVENANVDLPTIETGNSDWDAVIAFSNHVVLRSFVGPTKQLPGPSYVSARIPSRGFSPRGDGSDHGWQWNGQNAALGYLAIPAAAMLAPAPALAISAIMNAISMQQPDGWIDFKPGLGGQRANMLSFPAWASIAWRVHELTENRQLIEQIFPALVKFFERWFQPDIDKDQDGLPEWTNINQTGYSTNPLFARYARWAQNADINKAETPDLAGYLINEGRSLIHMANLLDKQSEVGAIGARLDVLSKQLESLWDETAGNYRVRDRETDLTSVGMSLFAGKGDEAFDTHTQLDPPNRLILRVIGGKDHMPKVSVTIEGIDAKGKPTAETVLTNIFAWGYGSGSAVSEHAYSQINYVKFEGLSRVYSVEISTVDLRHFNLTNLLPFWASEGNTHISRMLQTITNPAQYWREYGLPVCAANDPHFAANNDGGSGGVWMLWNTLIIEGLLQHDKHQEAVTLFTRLMNAQIKSLRQDHAFREAYNSETGQGLGDIDELGGVMPLQLVMQLIGVRMINRRRVWAGGIFALPNSVKVTQFGIEVTRSNQGTTVKFPTGHRVTVDSTWQVIEDSTPEPIVEEVGKEDLEQRATEIAMQPNDSLFLEPLDLPATASVIPVDAKKDDTLEIPISQIDFTPQQDSPNESTGDSPRVFKIPVSGPKSDS